MERRGTEEVYLGAYVPRHIRYLGKFMRIGTPYPWFHYSLFITPNSKRYVPRGG